MSAIISIHKQGQPSFFVMHESEDMDDSGPACLGNLLLDMLSKYKTKPEILWVPSQIATALLKHKKDTGFSLKDIYGAESCNWSYVIDTDKKTAEIFKVEDDSGNVKYLNVLSCYLNSDLSIEDCKKICGKLKKPKIQLKPKKEAGTEVKRGSTSTNAAKPLKSAASKTTNKTASKTKVAKPRA